MSATKKVLQKVHRFVSNDLTVRMAVVDATAVVQEMQQIHSSMPLATLGVGRAMVAATLMAASLKEGQAVGLLFRGNGPLGSIYAEATYEGHVRGYCPYPEYQAPQSEDVLKLGKALGSGTLTVARHLPFQKQPHNGTVQMVSGEVGDDIAHYLEQSHQIRSLVSLGVYLDSYGIVKAAGGVLIEVMPGVEDQIVDLIAKNHEDNKVNISEMILKNVSAFDLISPYMKGIPFTEISHEPQISYFCPCTQERVKNALSILGERGIEEMIAEQKPSEVTCQICGRKYEVGTDELKALLVETRKNSLH
jgi:molecular chaperone Hsp33